MKARSSGRMAVVIPAAARGRMRGNSSRALVDLGGQTLLGRQVEVVRSVMPKAEIIVVAGQEAEAVHRSLPRGVKLVENEMHGDTGVVRSIGMGLRVTDRPIVWIVYGDLVFDERAFAAANSRNSHVLVAPPGDFDPDDAGVVAEWDVEINSEVVAHLDFGHPRKWAQVAMLADIELVLAREYACRYRNAHRLGFEMLNHVVDEGGRLKAVDIEAGSIVEVDVLADVARAVSYANARGVAS